MRQRHYILGGILTGNPGYLGTLDISYRIKCHELHVLCPVVRHRVPYHVDVLSLTNMLLWYIYRKSSGYRVL